MTLGKAFEIPKALIWESYRAVKKNRGAPGCDGETIKDFDRKRDKNLYKIWNRMCSGSYLPPPVLEKKIPKGDGRDRTLGIPTVADRVAQGAVKILLEEKLDPLFHEDSYGYRPNKSAHQALEKAKKRCWEYNWVVEVDIKGFFDNVEHEYVVKALKHHGFPSWAVLYCERWLKAPMQDSSGEVKQRTKGTPQGGVISPLLANLFLHYAFDCWMGRELPTIQFERYADDIVCHASSMKDACRIREKIARRMKSVGLEINETKSKIVYVDTFERWNVETTFTFLGYDFRVRNLKDFRGKYFRKVMPGASKKALRQITETVKSWKIHRSTNEDLKAFARRYNATIRGWIEYYGKHWYWNFHYHLWTVVQSRVLKWVRRTFRIGQKKAERWLANVRKEQPKLFAHWYLLKDSNV